MAHLHIHLDARAAGNDGLEQIRSAHAFAQNEQRYDARRRAAPPVEAATISWSKFQPLVAALGHSEPRTDTTSGLPLSIQRRSASGARSTPPIDPFGRPGGVLWAIAFVI